MTAVCTADDPVELRRKCRRAAPEPYRLDQAADAERAASNVRRAKPFEPVGLSDCVVIDERDDVAGCRGDAGVARRGETALAGALEHDHVGFAFKLEASAPEKALVVVDDDDRLQRPNS